MKFDYDKLYNYCLTTTENKINNIHYYNQKKKIFKKENYLII